MTHKGRTLSVIIALGLALNLASCAQKAPPQPETATPGGAYQQEQKMLWSTDPQGSGESTDWGLYMDEEGGGR
jgi:hypothetical protein